MHAFTHGRTLTHTLAFAHIRLARMHARTHARMHARTHARMHARTHARTHSHTHTRARTYVPHTHAIMHVVSMMHVCTSTHSHAHTSLKISPSVTLNMTILPLKRGGHFLMRETQKGYCYCTLIIKWCVFVYWPPVIKWCVFLFIGLLL